MGPICQNLSWNASKSDDASYRVRNSSTKYTAVFARLIACLDRDPVLTAFVLRGAGVQSSGQGSVMDGIFSAKFYEFQQDLVPLVSCMYCR